MRKVMLGLACAILAVVAWGIASTALGVAVYPDAGINVNFPPADLYVVADTVCCKTAHADTIVPDGKYVLGWCVVVKANAATIGVTVNVSPAATRVSSGTGLLKSGAFIVRQGESYFSHVPIDTLTIKGIWGSVHPDSVVHYQVFVEQMKWD